MSQKKPTDRQFQAAIARTIQAAGSQGKAAELLGVTRETVNRWAKGGQRPRPLTMQAVIDRSKSVDLEGGEDR